MTASRARKCGNKRQYLTYRAALVHVARLQEQEGVAEGGVSAYRCKYGRHWHVGHTPKRRATR